MTRGGSQNSMAAIIRVADVAPGGILENSTRTCDAIRAITGVRPEAFGDNGVNQVIAKTRIHGLVEAARLAFSSHLDLVLSPDDLWLTIAQGFALHVQVNKLKAVFIQPSISKKTLTLKTDFVKGVPQNNWPKLLCDLSNHVAESLGCATRDLFLADFSTTTEVEKAAYLTALLDVSQEFYHYTVNTYCGIPHIVLAGRKEDWQRLRCKVQRLAFANCESWVTSLDQVLEYFVRAFEGSDNPDFWKDFYRAKDSAVSGWINVFFPYTLNQDGTTKYNSNGNPCNLGEYPKGFNRVPFVWDHFVSRIPMEFVCGFLGVRCIGQAIKPVISWAVSQPRSERDPDLVIQR